MSGCSGPSRLLSHTASSHWSGVSIKGIKSSRMAPGVPVIGWHSKQRKWEGSQGEGRRPFSGIEGFETCTAQHFWSCGLESASLRGAEELSFSWIGYQSKYNQASYEGNSMKQRLRKQLPSNKRLIDLHSKVKCGVLLAYCGRGWYFHTHVWININTSFLLTLCRNNS